MEKDVELPIDKAGREDVDWREATRVAAGMWRDRVDTEDLMGAFRSAFKRRFPTVYEPPYGGARDPN